MNALEKRRLLHERRTRRKGSGAGRWLLFIALGMVALGGITASIGLGVVYAKYQSYAEDYVPIDAKLAQTNVGLTEVYDRNGVFLGALTNPNAQLLEKVPLEQIAPAMIEATISTEDDAFYEHIGFNWRGVLRAAKERYVDKNEEGGTGGSSITQQLVKNVYICPNIVSHDTVVCTAARTADRKMRELVYAIELEKDYSKDEILTWYLNQVSYADRYIGVQAAAQGYFKKDAKDLTLAEAALLSGIPAFPTRYHPRDNCEFTEAGQKVIDEQGRCRVIGLAKERQEFVLDLMVEHERLTPEEAAAAKAEPLLVYEQSNPIRAEAWLDNQVEPRLVRMCAAGILPLIKGAEDCVQSVHAAGYRVKSTIDIIETELAQEMIRGFIETGVANGCNCFNGAIATIEPSTGQVIVYAPNRDRTFRSDVRVRGEIDQLTEINQPGSSFKPLIYLNWMETLGKAPMNTFWDTSPLSIAGVDITNPRNDGKSSEGLISARAALGGSQNVGAFRAAAEGGVDNVIALAGKMGITTLAQNFDPTFLSHPDVTYGASIATGGANIRAIDMAYMNTVFSNMGVMVGVPSYATYRDVKDFKSILTDKADDNVLANKQYEEFNRGNLRLTGTRELDPVTVLEVIDHDGKVIYDHKAAGDLQKKQVVDAGSVWLMHSIISDCGSRFIIWGCGGSNSDLGLDAFSDGEKIPSGVKTGTQQGPKSASDTLETWMNGYSRYAGTAVWVGNSNNELVNDRAFAAANTTVRLFKSWMGEYHSYLRRTGVITGPLKGFDEVRPKNVAQVSFKTTATDRGLEGGCEQRVTGWARTDVTYDDECEYKEVDSRNGLLATEDTPAQFKVKEGFRKLPALKPDAAQELVKTLKNPKVKLVPTEKSNGVAAVAISSPANGRTYSGTVPVIATIGVSTPWKLEFCDSAGACREIGSGEKPVQDANVGAFDTRDLAEGVYSVKLTSGTFSTVVTFNVRKSGSAGPTPQSPFPNRTPVPTPTP
jgi:membrane peptidoglycan carboxypeptidase